jgi:CheY-like chemotaxis protein
LNAQVILRTAMPDEIKQTARGSELTARACRRVLIVDDNADSADMMKVLLDVSGHDTRVAYDAARAIQIALEFAPEVGLLDIGLPDMDGYELARALRTNPQLSGLFLVALTGWGQDEDRRRAREAGFDAHITKPADPAVLERLVERRIATP